MPDFLKALPINWGLAANPLNWAIIILMVAIPLIAVDHFIRHQQG